MTATRKPLDPYTLSHVARELLGLAEAFHQAPPSLPQYRRLDQARGDILKARGRTYLAEARALTRKAKKERKK